MRRRNIMKKKTVKAAILAAALAAVTLVGCGQKTEIGRAHV